MTEPLLQIERLTKRFGGVIASDAITLDIPRGEFHAIIGTNGAGKTTLIGLLAGALLANNTDFVSPAVMFWTRSGDLMVMVVLGGLATPFGPLIGTVTYLLLEEALSRVTEYPGLFLGPTLLLVAIFLHGGIAGLFERRAP